MIKPLRLSSLAWLAVPLGALGFLLGVNAARIRQVEAVNALGGERPAATTPAAASEFAPGNRLIVPEGLAGSYHWLAQTQRMFLRDEWRVRHIDYENAPDGRPVLAPSPYRWWLGFVAWCDSWRTGRPPALAVESAALVADPLLLALGLLAGAGFIAWRFGAFPAALVAVGGITLFPFAASFLPGVPDDRGLAQLLALANVLLLAAGVTGPAAPRRGFILAGIAGGLGLWVAVSLQLVVLAGIVAGGLLAAWVARRGAGAAAVLPWRAWAGAGALTTCTAYLLEFAPAHLGKWELSAVHPLHAVAWLGAGELLALASAWIQEKKAPHSPRSLAGFIFAAAAIAALPVVIWKTQGAEFFLRDVAALRLTNLPGSPVAPNLAAWLAYDGPAPAVWATLLPLLLVVPAAWLLLRRAGDLKARAAVALALGPVLVVAACACRQLAWWSAADALLLALLAMTLAAWPWGAARHFARLAWVAAAFFLLLPGAVLTTPRARGEIADNLSRPELLGLIERDLGNWLALHGDPSGIVVLAPPNETTGLCYYGGLRGIGSLSLENRPGVTAAMRVLSAPGTPEAMALIYRREITHVVLPSWDSTFDDYARATTGRVEGSFRDQLRFSKLPLGLRPLAYALPAIAGFAGQSVLVLEVVEEQDEATALARIAAYLVEMGRLDEAAAAAQGLRRFPADFGAAVARAEVELARGDEAAFARSLKLLQARLGGKTSPALLFDQRVSLAIVLARAKQEPLAREQVRLCFATADEQELRRLAPGALYRLLVLGRAFDQKLEPELHELALTLLPRELRERLK